MSFESVSAGSEVYKFHIQGAEWNEVRFLNLCSSLLIYATSITHPYCRLNCQQSSCIVDNGGATFCQWRRMCGSDFYIFCMCDLEFQDISVPKGNMKFKYTLNVYHGDFFFLPSRAFPSSSSCCCAALISGTIVLWRFSTSTTSTFPDASLQPSEPRLASLQQRGMQTCKSHICITHIFMYTTVIYCLNISGKFSSINIFCPTVKEYNFPHFLQIAFSIMLCNGCKDSFAKHNMNVKICCLLWPNDEYHIMNWIHFSFPNILHRCYSTVCNVMFIISSV